MIYRLRMLLFIKEKKKLISESLRIKNLTEDLKKKTKN